MRKIQTLIARPSLRGPLTATEVLGAPCCVGTSQRILDTFNLEHQAPICSRAWVRAWGGLSQGPPRAPDSLFWALKATGCMRLDTFMGPAGRTRGTGIVERFRMALLYSANHLTAGGPIRCSLSSENARNKFNAFRTLHPPNLMKLVKGHQPYTLPAVA